MNMSGMKYERKYVAVPVYCYKRTLWVPLVASTGGGGLAGTGMLNARHRPPLPTTVACSNFPAAMRKTFASWSFFANW